MAAPIPTLIYHLTHIDNLASISQSGGCLSFNQKQNQGIDHVDVAYKTVQVRRAQTSVPCGSGGYLHDYVPFFFAPRPPMLYAIYRGYVEGYEQGQAPLIHLVGRSRYAAEKKSKIVYNSYTCPISGTF
jgi:ssDNA thymidine ADP-ribosyltransferase DarT-like protein